MIARRVWTYSLVAAALFVYVACFSTGAWWKMGVGHMRPGFADMRQLLSASECAREGVDIYRVNPCDEVGRPYTYSSLLLRTMMAMKLDPSEAASFGVLSVLIFTFAAGFLLAPRSPGEFLVGFAFLASSATLLGVERANIDLLLTAGIGVAALGAASKNGPAWGWIALGILPATFVKYYPVLAVPGIALALSHRRQRITLVLGAVAAVVAYFCVFPQDIVHIRHSTPLPVRYPVEFGAYDLVRMLLPAAHVRWIAGALAPTAAAMGVLIGINLPPVELTRRDRFLLFAGVSVYFSCFFLVSNWEYRRVLLALAFPALSRYGSSLSPVTRGLGAVALAAGLMLCWSPLWLRNVLILARELQDSALVTPLAEFKGALDWTFAVLLVACAAASREAAVSVDEWAIDPLKSDSA